MKIPVIYFMSNSQLENIILNNTPQAPSPVVPEEKPRLKIISNEDCR